MTSSLVGSEMCIRDRWLRVWLWLWLWSCALVLAVVAVVVVVVVVVVVGAVSYTHLTLPTICSV
eukprot:1553100-Prorocentrum_lima.AAC.1